MLRPCVQAGQNWNFYAFVVFFYWLVYSLTLVNIPAGRHFVRPQGGEIFHQAGTHFPQLKPHAACANVRQVAHPNSPKADELGQPGQQSCSVNAAQ